MSPRRWCWPVALAGLLTLLTAMPRPAGAVTARWVQEMPPDLSGLPWVFDSHRQRVLILTYTGIWAISYDSPPRWAQIYQGTMKVGSFVYDPILDRIWSFTMSFGSGAPGTLYHMDLGASSLAWVEDAFSGGAPYSFSDFATGFDPVRHRIILVGGTQAGLETQLVAILGLNGTPGWSTYPGIGPGGRGGAMVYDPVRDRMLLHGGSSGLPATYSNECWGLSMSGPITSWYFLHPKTAIPGGRAGHEFLLDGAHQRAIVIGGSAMSNDAWALDLSLATRLDSAAWTRLPDLPVVRSSTIAWIDSLQSRLAQFGGWILPSYDRRYDSWALPLDSAAPWSALSADSLRPPALVGHVAFSGGSSGRWFTATGSPSDVWSRLLPNDSPWSKIATGGPGPRYWAGAANDDAGSQALVFGGTSQSTFGFTGPEYADLWSFDMTNLAWSPLSPPSTPTPREAALTLFDPVRRRLIVQGGGATQGGRVRPLSDTWIYDLAANSWSAPAVGGYGGRWMQAGIYDPMRDQLVAFGGADTASTYTDVHVLPLGAAGAWSLLVTSGGPAPTVTNPGSVRAAYDPIGDRMIVLNAESGLLKAYALTLGASPTWSLVALDGNSPPARENYAFAVNASTGRLLVAEGTDLVANQATQDAWLLYLDSTTAALVSMVSSSASPEGVRIVWQLSPGTGQVFVDRRAGSEEWQRLGAFVPDGSNWVEVRDTRVAAGRTYDYRIVAIVNGSERPLGQVRISVPSAPALFLGGALPNPSSGALRVRFGLGRQAPGVIEVFDVLGHRVLRRDVGSFGAGTHTIELTSEDRPLAPGLYFIRLAQGGATLRSRVAVIR